MSRVNNKLKNKDLELLYSTDLGLLAAKEKNKFKEWSDFFAFFLLLNYSILEIYDISL